MHTRTHACVCAFFFDCWCPGGGGGWGGPGIFAGAGCEELHDSLGRLRLAGAGFAADQDGLALLVDHHVRESLRAAWATVSFPTAGRSVCGRRKDPGLKFIRNKLRPANFLVSQVSHVWCFGGDYLTYETASSRIFMQHLDEAPCACGRAHKKGRACSAMAYTWGVSCPCCTPRYWAIMRPPYWWRSRLCGFTCVHGRCPLAVSFAFCASFSPGEFFSGGHDLLMLRPPRRVPLCPAAAKCTALNKAAACCPEDWCRSPATQGKRAQPTLRSAVDGHEGRGPKPNHKTKWRKPVRLRTGLETFHPTQDQGAAWRAFRSEARALSCRGPVACRTAIRMLEL